MNVCFVYSDGYPGIRYGRKGVKAMSNNKESDQPTEEKVKEETGGERNDREKTETAEETLPAGMGERIAYLRRRGGLTQAQLAEQLGISAQAVSKWESGSSCPDIMLLMPLSKIFHISTDVLLGGSALEIQGKQSEDAARMVEIAARALNEETRSGGGQGAGGQDANGWDAGGSAVGDSEAAETGPEWEMKDKTPSGEEQPVNGEIHSLRLDLGAAEAFIREGSEFSLTTTGYGEGDCRSTVENGVWRVSDKGTKDLFFGLGIRNFFRGRKVVLTVPAGSEFRELRLNIGAGTVMGEALRTEKAVLSVGAGQMTLVNFASRESEMKCGMGEIKLDGELSGKCHIDCGMGSISARLAPLAQYGYSLSVGMGDVKVGDNGFTGISGRHKMNAGADNFFNINCGMGAVSISFR